MFTYAREKTDLSRHKCHQKPSMARRLKAQSARRRLAKEKVEVKNQQSPRAGKDFLRS